MRPAVFVLVTLALSAPTLSNIMGGNEGIGGAGLHLAAAILVSWVAVGTIGYLVDSYRASSARSSQRDRRAQGPQ